MFAPIQHIAGRAKRTRRMRQPTCESRQTAALMADVRSPEQKRGPASDASPDRQESINKSPERTPFRHLSSGANRDRVYSRLLPRWASMNAMLRFRDVMAATLHGDGRSSSGATTDRSRRIIRMASSVRSREGPERRVGRGSSIPTFLGMIDRLPRLVCAQAENANPLYRSSLSQFKQYKPIRARRTLASAIQIGDPVSIHRAVAVLKAFESVVEQASEEELADASALADRTGLFNCPHTGVALAVLFKLLERRWIQPHEKVVVISTAHGLKFTDFKRRYHEGKLRGLASRHANRPIELPADYGEARDAIFRALEQHSGEKAKG